MNFKRLIKVLVATGMLLVFFGCSSTRYISFDNPESQASVRINLKDGSFREGIIVTGDSTQLIYVDSKTHERTAIKFAQIRSIQKISKYFDFEGHAIPISEIKEYKGMKNTLLYGGAGLFLGAAVGTGVGIGLYAADQPLLANLSILVFGGLGAYYFGSKGAVEDYEVAAFKARKARYEEYKKLRAEKRKLEELKRKKAELLKKLEEKKRKKGALKKDVQ